MLRSLRSGMMRRMANGSPLLSATPSATRLLVAASGSGTLCSNVARVTANLTCASSPYKANPAYKGKWYAPMIDNPEYKGPWAPRKIPNPDYFEDLTPVKSLNKIVRVFCAPA